MVLRCSLLGHDYGETDVEREREERGSEVVVTVQEYEECLRCGERTVISENTEVTSLTTETDDTRPDEPDTETEIDSEDAAVEFIDAAVDEAELVDADVETATDAAQPDAAADADPVGDDSVDEDDEIEIPTDENGDPVTDDGEILDDESEPPEPRSDRGHGEWPDSDDVGPPVGADNEPEGWPDDEAEQGANGEAERLSDDETERLSGDETEQWSDDEGEPAPADDAVVFESDESNDDPIGINASPPEADAIETEAQPDDTADSDPGTGIKRARSAPAPTDGRASPEENAATELYCPNCEYVAGSDRSSLRTGDICSECRKGYLSERTR